MAAEHDTAAPPRSVRTFDPPWPVWIQLRQLLPIGPTDDTPGDAEQGLRIDTEVPGLARETIPRADAGMLVLVTYPLWTGDGQHQTTVTHYVPLHLVRRRSTRRGERENT
ncbi:hypothetical protein FHS23_004583 [Prauserella isguenensis]|uniref:Uncharacterized protein n=1 Tax=Prauserella isguenensis TaxID=1470180 RepID=A0A839SA35_9PSEU|nr:hypothetical protein [Prauserella isguenensis]MBB3053529.1 hypothetical protein [Prauserella isguenensis]